MIYLLNLKKLSALLIIFIFAFSELAFAGSFDLYRIHSSDHSDNFIFDYSHQNNISMHFSSSHPNANKIGFDLGSAHKYLGYSTLLFGGIAAFSSSYRRVHEIAETSASLLAIATCSTGFIEYGDYFDINEGMSDYNIHVVLGTLATVGFAATVALASADEDHGGIGRGSAALMLIPIIVVPW